MRTMSERAHTPNVALVELRQRARLSRPELARLAKVAPNTVLNAERGIIPSAKSQRRIAAALAKALVVARMLETLERMRDTPALGAELERELWPADDDEPESDDDELAAVAA